ncbi:uncharacterized protein LOC122074396 [Macadamia integrifolia]|uniref:uncharacterized protein LOC122074396 n=1 Tax=Macadamia integrifolia TaxID=60698 RepID=UPI001C5022A6|nr:uncharacterized protein LOC122074396 [Macadamia integrifolia]
MEQKIDSDLQLASRKNRVSRGCAAFVCFGRASGGLEGPSPPKVGPVQQQDIVAVSPAVSDKNEDSSGEGNFHETSNETVSEVPGFERRKVQWTDAHGKELVEVRELELRYGFFALKL